MKQIKYVSRLRTTGVLAKDLGVSLHRVVYILRTRPHIQPVAKEGNLRLYDRDAYAMIRYELKKIEAKRNSQNQGGGK